MKQISSPRKTCKSLACRKESLATFTEGAQQLHARAGAAVGVRQAQAGPTPGFSSWKLLMVKVGIFTLTLEGFTCSILAGRFIRRGDVPICVD